MSESSIRSKQIFIADWCIVRLYICLCSSIHFLFNCQMSQVFVCIDVLENKLTNQHAVDHKNEKKKKKTVKSSTIDAPATTTSQCLCIGRCDGGPCGMSSKFFSHMFFQINPVFVCSFYSNDADLYQEAFFDYPTNL